MIKVNLLKNLNTVQMGETNYGEDIVLKETGNNGWIPTVIKVLILLIPIILLNVYESYQLKGQESRLQELQKNLGTVNAEITALGDAPQKVRKFFKEKESIDKRVSLIESLSKGRLNSIVVLDNIQSLVPARVWLTELVFEEQKVNLGGFAYTEEGVQELVNSLEDSVIFSNVTFQNSLQKDNDSGELQVFTVDFELEDI